MTIFQCQLVPINGNKMERFLDGNKMERLLDGNKIESLLDGNKMETGEVVGWQ